MPSEHKFTMTESNFEVSARSISRLQPPLCARSVLCGYKAALLIKRLAWFSSKRLQIDASVTKNSKTRVRRENKKRVSTIY